MAQPRTDVRISDDKPPSVVRKREAPPLIVATNLLMVAGAGLVAWSAAIHLDLWRQDYRYIPTIGPLFLAQVVGGFTLAGVILATRRLFAALAGAVFLISTIGGLAISVWFGLFGFKDNFSAPLGTLSLTVEALGTVVLFAAATLRWMVVKDR
jgi:hypothetical protein